MYLFKVTLNRIEIPNDAISWVRNVKYLTQPASELVIKRVLHKSGC